MLALFTCSYKALSTVDAAYVNTPVFLDLSTFSMDMLEGLISTAL